MQCQYASAEKISTANKQPRSFSINNNLVSFALCKHRQQVETWKEQRVLNFSQVKSSIIEVPVTDILQLLVQKKIAASLFHSEIYVQSKIGAQLARKIHQCLHCLLILLSLHTKKPCVSAGQIRLHRSTETSKRFPKTSVNPF